MISRGSKDREESSVPKEALLTSKLDIFEINLANYHVDFAIIEELLLNEDIRELLNKKSDSLKRFVTLYHQAMDLLVEELFQISRYRFVAVPKEELRYISSTSPAKTPKYLLVIQNVESLTAYVINDVLQHENPVLSAIACSRWVQIMMRLVCRNDFPSALAIFGAFNTVLSRYVDKKYSKADQATLNMFDYFKKIFDPGSKHEAPRDLFFGSAIPQIENYANFINAIKENVIDTVAADPSRISQTEKVLSTLQAMQTFQSQLMNIDLITALHVKDSEGRCIGFENTIFTDLAAQNARLAELCKSMNGKATDDVQEMRYFLKDKRWELWSAPFNKIIEEINPIFLTIHKRFSIAISEAQARYQKCIYELNQYASSSDEEKDKEKSRKALTEDSKKRREYIKNLLISLRWESDTLKKIAIVEGAFMVHDKLIEQYDELIKKHPELINKIPRGLFNEPVYKILTRLCSALRNKDNEDKQPLIEMEVNKYLAGMNKSEDLKYTPVAQDKNGKVTLRMPRLNLSSSKRKNSLNTLQLQQSQQVQPQPRTRFNLEIPKSTKMTPLTSVVEPRQNTHDLSSSDYEMSSCSDDEAARNVVVTNNASTSVSPLASPGSTPPAASPALTPKQSPGRVSPKNLSPNNSALNLRGVSKLLSSPKSSTLFAQTVIKAAVASEDRPSTPLESPTGSDSSQTSPKEAIPAKNSDTAMPSLRYRVSRTSHDGDKSRTSNSAILRRMPSEEKSMVITNSDSSVPQSASSSDVSDPKSGTGSGISSSNGSGLSVSTTIVPRLPVSAIEELKDDRAPVSDTPIESSAPAAAPPPAPISAASVLTSSADKSKDQAKQLRESTKRASRQLEYNSSYADMRKLLQGTDERDKIPQGTQSPTPPPSVLSTSGKGDALRNSFDGKKESGKFRMKLRLKGAGAATDDDVNKSEKRHSTSDSSNSSKDKDKSKRNSGSVDRKESERKEPEDKQSPRPV